jgi:CPA2 family monovalent cation:H+ antiporter-2
VAIVAVVVLGKGLTALAMVRLLGYPLRTGLTVAAGLAQVGEFSFILADLGQGLGLLPGEGHSLILAAAIVSITLNPLVFAAVAPLEGWLRRRPRLASILERRSEPLSTLVPPPHGALRGHTVLCGYGRVGRLVAHALERRGFTYVVIEQDRRSVERLRCRGVQALHGDAANPLVLEHAHVQQARVLVVALDDPPVTRHIVEQARRLHPRLAIVARTHSEAEWRFLRERAVDDVVLGERELAAEMARYTLHRLGVGGTELQVLVQGLRRHGVEA